MVSIKLHYELSICTYTKAEMGGFIIINWNYAAFFSHDSLFYIAGLCYQWLKSDVLSSDLLRSGELLLLKVCVTIMIICGKIAMTFD